MAEAEKGAREDLESLYNEESRAGVPTPNPTP